MEEARNIMVEAMDDLRKGKMPQKVAEIIHKNGHSIAQNQFAEVKHIETLGSQKVGEMLDSAQERLKDMG